MLTETEIEDVKKLGYTIDMPPALAVQQLNGHFPGIELYDLLKQVDALLDAHADKPIYKRLVIDVTPEPFFEIIYRSVNHSDAKKGLMLIRAFYYADGGLIAKHTYFSLPEDAR